MEPIERLIFHIDVNSAFLSWEATKRVMLGEEDLRLVPSIIGGDPKSRTSIVAAKSIPAKAYGINTGEPVSMALQKCPHLIVVPSDFGLYKQCSAAFKAICKSYAPVMESFSIDEVFLDMSGTKNVYPDPIATAHEIKDRIREELGFTVNVGIGKNKLCAKMASDFEKPDRVHTLFPEEIAEKMWPLDVGELFSVGKSSAAKLREYGIRTIGDLANAPIEELKGFLGERSAMHFHRFANGIDESPVTEEREDAKSYSVETTIDENLTSVDDVKRLLLSQADIVALRLRRDQAKCRCVAVSYRELDFKTRSHQRKLFQSTNVTAEIYEVACDLFEEFWNGKPMRLIGLSLSDIDRDDYEQMSLIVDEKKEKLKKLDGALDSIRGKFGTSSIKRASTLDSESRVGKKYRD